MYNLNINKNYLFCKFCFAYTFHNYNERVYVKYSEHVQ